MTTAGSDGYAGWRSGLPALTQAIIDHSPVGIAVVDYDGIYRDVNPSYCSLYGYAPGELLGHSFLIVFAPHQRVAILERHRQFLSAGGTLSGEFDVVRRDGSALSIVSESVRLPAADPRGMRLVYVVDITARRRMELELRASEQMYRTLFETVPQGIVYHDASGAVTAVNPAAEHILGVSADALRANGRQASGWDAVREDGTVLASADYPYAVALRTGQPVRNFIMGVVTGNRGRRWMRVDAMPLYDGDRIDQVYTCFEDVTERIRHDGELARAASTDFLTGCANRRTVADRLVLEKGQLARHPDRTCAVLMIDIDDFKLVNDRHGHAAGDVVLRHVTKLIQGEVRATDLVGRVGGEEFVVVMPDAPGEQAEALAERLRGAIANSAVALARGACSVTVSIGIGQLAACDHGIHEVLERADRALYAAKRAGRNQVCAGA